MNKKEENVNNIIKDENTKKVILSLNNIYKTYYLGQIPNNALDGVDLDIYEGEILVILGPSGSRKNYFAKRFVWS